MAEGKKGHLIENPSKPMAVRWKVVLQRKNWMSYQKKKARIWAGKTLYCILDFACISLFVHTQEMLVSYKREKGISLNLENCTKMQRQLWVPPPSPKRAKPRDLVEIVDKKITKKWHRPIKPWVPESDWLCANLT